MLWTRLCGWEMRSTAGARGYAMIEISLVKDSEVEIVSSNSYIRMDHFQHIMLNQASLRNLIRDSEQMYLLLFVSKVHYNEMKKDMEISSNLTTPLSFAHQLARRLKTGLIMMVNGDIHGVGTKRHSNVICANPGTEK